MKCFSSFLFRNQNLCLQKKRDRPSPLSIIVNWCPNIRLSIRPLSVGIGQDCPSFHNCYFLPTAIDQSETVSKNWLGSGRTSPRVLERKQQKYFLAVSVFFCIYGRVGKLVTPKDCLPCSLSVV